MGFGDYICKLAMMSHRQREELIEKLHALPGHKSKLNEFFKVIEKVITIIKTIQLFPKNAIIKTLESAGVKIEKSDRDVSTDKSHIQT